MDNTTNYNTRDEALYYISIGMPIIPLCSPTHQGMNVAHCSKCHSQGKAPLLKEWAQWSVTSKEDVNKWFNQNSLLNIGVPLGQISGIIGLDIDGRQGEVTLLAMSEGDIPETWEYNTGQGRRLLYGLPKGIATKKLTVTGTKAHEEFAILGDGQQTVLPPSTHSSGRKYVWKTGYSPRDIAIAQAPQWVIDKIKDTGVPSLDQKKSQSITEDDWQRTLHEGERNEEMTRRAGSLIGRGLPQKQVLDFLVVQNSNYCDPPMTFDELSLIVESIYEREKMKKAKKGRKASEDDKVEFKPTPFAKQFLFRQKELGFLWKYSADMGNFFRCDETSGPWEMLDMDYVKSELRKLLINEDVQGHCKWDSIHYTIESIEALKAELVAPGENNIFDMGFSIINNSWAYNPTEIIPFKNGVFEWRKNILHPWNSKIYTTIKLPVDYDPTAECPEWIKALNAWIPDEQSISFLQEFCGLCLIPDTAFRTAVFLYGSGANGKSMFLDTIRTLFGDSLVSIPLHRLTNRFETAYLQNKLINICGDIDSKYITETGVLKALIGGDMLRGEIKHGKSFDFIPVCRLMFSANNLPKVVDKTIGWISRWKFIEFPHTFPINPGYKIEHTLMFEKEKAGILNWCIQGLQQLKETNKWTVSKTMQKSEDEYREENDNVSAFLTANVNIVGYVGHTEQAIVISALHKCYLEWIEENLTGTQTVAPSEFIKRIQGSGIKKGVRTINGKSANVILGVVMKDDALANYKHWLNMSNKNLF